MATNGRLDTSTLVKVDGWAYLTMNAAAAWGRGCDELVALGYARPTITAPDGAYRTFAEQQYWKTYWTNRGLPQNAATPGTSGHGWATDVDIWNFSKWPHAVLERVFGKYGFTFNVPWEAWHMHHNGMAVAALNVSRIPEQKKEELDMTDIKYYWKDEKGIEYGIMGRDLPGGWEASTEKADGEAYGILYGTPEGAPWDKLTYAKWVNAQKLAKRLSAARVAELTEIAKAAGGGTDTTVNFPTKITGTLS